MRYALYSSAQINETDANGNPVAVAPKTVINTVLWDGVTPYDPGPTMVLVQSDTLQIGDTYNGI